MAITLSSYNRQITAVEDLKNLLSFKVFGSCALLTRQQANGILKGFKQESLKYLNGDGHPSGMAPNYVSQEEYNRRASDRLFRAKIVLQCLTDSWLLPVGNGDKIKVRPNCPTAHDRLKTLSLDKTEPISLFRSSPRKLRNPDLDMPTRS
jgi:hypothetical protein